MNINYNPNRHAEVVVAVVAAEVAGWRPDDSAGMLPSMGVVEGPVEAVVAGAAPAVEVKQGEDDEDAFAAAAAAAVVAVAGPRLGRWSSAAGMLGPRVAEGRPLHARKCPRTNGEDGWSVGWLLLHQARARTRTRTLSTNLLKHTGSTKTHRVSSSLLFFSALLYILPYFFFFRVRARLSRIGPARTDKKILCYFSLLLSFLFFSRS